MHVKRAVFVVPVLIFSGLLGFSSSQTTSRTVLDSVFTAAQAERGVKQYEANCVRCHEGADPEGPTLMGKSFVDRWREDNLDVLFNYTKSRMPASSAGSLSDAAYLDVLTFLLEANGFPHGSQELTLDALERIRLVGPEGPRPLPNNTLVLLVGCLTQSPTNDWDLSPSTSPVRSRQGMETTEEELKHSAAKSLGTETFRLQNFTNIRFDYKPDALKGHKVQVKGVLIRQGNTERVTVTSIDSLATSCK